MYNLQLKIINSTRVIVSFFDENSCKRVRCMKKGGGRKR